MIHHLVTGAGAGQAIAAAVGDTPDMAGEVWTLHEQLQVGPLKRGVNKSFDETRAAWWQTILPADKQPPAGAQDLLLQLGNALHKSPNDVVWIWLAPHAAEISAYYFALSQLAQHRGRIHLVQIAGLPFLDEQQKLIFPKSFAGLSARELAKCQKLVRLMTPSEWELDLDVWQQLSMEDDAIRVAEGGKKLMIRGEDFFDAALLQGCTHSFQKAARIVQQAISRQELELPVYFLAHRLKQLATGGYLTLQGEPEKGLRDFEFKLPAALPA